MELKEVFEKLEKEKQTLFTQGKKSGLDNYNMGYLKAIENTLELLKSVE